MFSPKITKTLSSYLSSWIRPVGSKLYGILIFCQATGPKRTMYCYFFTVFQYHRWSFRRNISFSLRWLIIQCLEFEVLTSFYSNPSNTPSNLEIWIFESYTILRIALNLNQNDHNLTVLCIPWFGHIFIPCSIPTFL